MNTKPFFNAVVEKATIVVNQNHIDTYRAIIKKRRIPITEENFNEKENCTVFIVENLTQADLHQFDENDGNTCYIHHRVLRLGRWLVELSTVDTSKPSKYVSYGIFGFYRDDESKKFQKIAEIYADRKIGDDKPKGYNLNWGAWGSVDLMEARNFEHGIKLGVRIIEELEKEFC